MTQFPKLFSPGKIGNLEIKNRIVMAPMGNFTGDPEGFITDKTISYYVERARGGVGLIISNATPVLREARTPGRTWIFDDKFIPQFRKLADAVHKHGAKMALQMMHNGKTLFASLPLFTDPKEAAEIDVIGPSARTWVKTGQTTREMTKEDIERVVEAYAEGARRTKEAGFDAVELHGGHGYLISCFLSGYDNRRTDEYGGSWENKARFACEILRRVREKVGPDFPISLRISAYDALPGGITPKDTIRQAPLFVEAGADALHVSASNQETTEWQFLTYLWPDGGLVQFAEAIKKVVNVPIITVGKLSDPVIAERVLQEGRADFIALGRSLLADPELSNKSREGRVDDIHKCIYCGNCFTRTFKEWTEFGGLFCTVNPALCREREFAIKPTTSPKKLMVIGGGLAGMEASRVLAERGHQVSLYEKSDKLGGQWNIVCQQPEKEGFVDVTKHLTRGLDKAGVNVILNKEVTPQLVNEIKPDAVVVATGATPGKLNVPGIDGNNVVQAVDVITGKAKVGNRVVVVGGRLIGMETADFLAEQGKKVSIVTLHRLGVNGRKLNDDIYRTMRDRLIARSIPVYPDCPVVEINSDGAWANDNGNIMLLKADTVVLAVGAVSERGLTDQLKDIAPEIYTIGDCVEPRDALAAIRDGAEVGRKI